MKRVYLLVESPTNAAFVRRVLPPESQKDVEIAPVDSGLASLARTLLVLRRKPIAVLLDSDSLNPNVIAERRREVEELIRAANSAVPVKVVSVVPTIEAWFFAAPEAIERFLGQTISAEWRAFGKRDPKGVLQQLAANQQKTWDTLQAISSFDAHDVERIRAVPEVAELTAFLLKMQTSYQAA